MSLRRRLTVLPRYLRLRQRLVRATRQLQMHYPGGDGSCPVCAMPAPCPAFTKAEHDMAALQQGIRDPGRTLIR